MAEQNQAFSARLDDARRSAGLRWKDLAERCGINPRSMPNYSKHGRVPEWHILVKLAQLLNVSSDWLLTGKKAVAPKVSAPEPEPDPTAATMRQMASDKDGEITPDSMPKQVRANEQFLLEMAAWTRRMLILDLKRQPTIARRFRELMTELELKMEEQTDSVTPPGLPAGAERKQGGGTG